MNTHAAREPFELRGLLPQIGGGRFGFDGFLQLRIFVDRPVDVFQIAGFFVLLFIAGQRDAEFVRDHLCDPVGVSVRPTQHAAHVADHRLCAERAEGDDLRHGAVAVFLADVLDDLGPAVLAEIDVDIRRADAFGIQEPFEQQLELDRINVGDAHGVGNQRTCRRTTPRSDRDAVFFGPVDEVPDDEEIVHEPLFLQNGNLQGVAPLHFFGVRLRAVPAMDALFGDLAEILVLRLAGGWLVAWVFRGGVELETAALGDEEGVVARLGVILEERTHFRRGLEIEIRDVMHPLLVRHI